MLAFMYFHILLYVTITLTACQFKEHIDLQKVSEIVFKNEKYNILKPTLHIIRDHFKEFIQKRNNNDFPTDRVFLDRNGFRHFWKDMKLKPKSLRKADVSETEIAKSNTGNINIAAKLTTRNITTVKVKDKPRRKKKLEADVYTPAKPNLRGESVIIKTTFFCPFFGVITMSTSVDNFKEQNDTAR